MKKVCIATYEIENIHKNGGIATAYNHMADALVREGFDVTIFVTSNMNISQDKLKEAIKLFAQKNIKIIFHKEIPYNVTSIFDTYCSYQAYRTFETLKDYDFDIIHFPESSGDAYFVVHAKKAGIFFQNSIIIVGAHGSSEWVRECNENSNLTTYDFILDHLERDSIAYADYVISPSNYYIEWMKEHQFKLPGKTFSILNCPHMDARTPKISRIAGDKIREVVFFGRQEIRKGFDIFCDAILNFSLPENVTVTFLGKPTNTCSFEIYRSHLTKKYKINLIENYNSQQAIEYLLRDGVVAVIPSRSETMCYTVMECLLNGIPFIAAHSGAIPELIDSQYHNDVLFKRDWQSLAAKLEHIFTNGLPLARPSFKNEDILKKWMELHHAIITEKGYDYSRLASLNINGNIIKIELDSKKNEYIFNGFADQCLYNVISEIEVERILLSFNTDISPRMFKRISESKKVPNAAILFANFNSNGALLGTTSNQERFELIGADVMFQFRDTLPIPVSCLVYKQDLLLFIELHRNIIRDNYYFMKTFICFLASRNIALYTVPIACGWSESLYIDRDFEKSEKNLWLKYYKKNFSIHPDMIGKESIIEVVKHKDLSKEEKLCIKFAKSPKKFCADSKYLSLRILSKFLNR